MPRGYAKHYRGGAATATAPAKDPTSEELATSVRDFRHVKLLKEMKDMGQPQDSTINAILSPILSTVGERLAATMKETGQVPSVTDIDQELSRALNRVSTAQAIRALGDGQEKGPAPSSTSDLTSMATAAVDIHKGAADTSRQMAEEERLRRKEAEASVGNAVQQAVADEQEKSMTLLEMVKQMFEQRGEHQDKLHEIETKLIQSQSQSQVEEIKKVSTDAIEKLTGAFNEKLASLQRAHELELKLIEKDHEFEKFRLQGAAGASPQDKLNHIWAEVQGKDLLDEHEYKKQKRQSDLANQQNMAQVYKGIAEAIPQFATNLFGAGSQAPVNGIPGVLPPRPEEEAQ